MSLAKDVYRMSNRELNGLAQNRFIDEDTQVAIAVNPYLRCRQYLAENQVLGKRAIDILLAGRANSVKLNLVSVGLLNDDPEIISKVYRELPKSQLNMWRLGNAFLRNYWRNGSVTNTPPDVLLAIYTQLVAEQEESSGGTSSPWGRSYYNSHWNRALLEHQNCTEEIAVMMTHSNDFSIRNQAILKISELRKLNS